VLELMRLVPPTVDNTERLRAATPLGLTVSVATTLASDTAAVAVIVTLVSVVT